VTDTMVAQANAIPVGSSPRLMSIDVLTVLLDGSITTSELEALQATQMLPSASGSLKS
jgi:hypothetical protein